MRKETSPIPKNHPPESSDQAEKGVFSAYLKWRERHPEGSGFTYQELEAMRSREPYSENENAWLQSGIDALKDVEQNGYACTAEELGEKLAQLKQTSWNNQWPKQ